jgi:FAD/FMN-containing dehydrogenase
MSNRRPGEAGMSPDSVRRAIAGFSGTVLTRGTPGFDEARTLWNAMIDRHPAVILRPRTTGDVAAAVRYARRQGLQVAVKCGGHSAPGYSMCDGVVIDLSSMQQVTVDPHARVARAQGGALLRVLDAATQEHGLAVPAGAISHTGMGGLILGGGFGHLMRRYGLSIDNLIAAEVVLADSQVVWADEDHHPDLFWALRGGSGNFGVVTEFVLRCHPVGLLYVTAHLFKLADSREVLRAFRRHMETAPDELAWMSFFRGAPDFPWVPRVLVGEPILLMPLIWAGDAQEGHDYIESLAPWFGAAAVSASGVEPYSALQSQWDEVFRHGRRHYAKAGFLTALPDALLDSVVEHMGTVPSPHTQIEILRLGGAVERVAQDDTAFPHRTAKWPVNIIGLWEKAAHDPRNIDWVREAYDLLTPCLDGGVYVNYAGGDEIGGVRSAYGRTWDKLSAIKASYDPDNTFRSNANVLPERPLQGQPRARPRHKPPEWSSR